MEDLMIKIDNVSKEYKLGQIGGTTLQEELQRLRARAQGKEDPTKKIGTKDYNKGEKFLALDGVSFEVKKGERVGIIGHNGAGKSTLLKLLSRVTAPTSGTIGLNGRVASMLEVGTGFHGELTGRENIYMNGAILGMTKKEIDAKIEDIIDFSECRQFIDTPVKRYSSGMYVKLAFSVAAHLDSEIMIMDEVLAVGDMAFQKKCLDKMNEVSKNNGRTILYVSHNMSTIRQLCDRCVVMDHGHVIFDGDVEEAISIYTDSKIRGFLQFYKLSDASRHGIFSGDIIIQNIKIIQKIPLTVTENITFQIEWKSTNNFVEKVFIRALIGDEKGLIGISMSDEIINKVGINKYDISLGTSVLAPGQYFTNLEIFDLQNGNQKFHDSLKAFEFEIVDNVKQTNGFSWYKPWGNIYFPKMEVKNVEY